MSNLTSCLSTTCSITDLESTILLHTEREPAASASFDLLSAMQYKVGKRISTWL